MPQFLSIESALDVCSVTLSNDHQILFLKEEIGHNIHSSKLTVFISELTKESGIALKDLDAIIVSKGPGSYTGLRIGVSIAKGLAYSLDLPLISVNTLEALALLVVQKELMQSEAYYCPMIDARRMEVYWGLYDQNLNIIRETAASVIDQNFIKQFPTDKPIYFFANGMDKAKEKLSEIAGATFVENIQPSSTALAYLGFMKFKTKHFENVASFEPFYLKDFFTTAKIKE